MKRSSENQKKRNSEVGIVGTMEVLTEEGWTEVQKLETNQKVASVNPETREIEMDEALNVEISNDNTKVLHYKTRDVDIVLTPTQTAYVFYKNKKGQYVRKEILSADQIRKSNKMAIFAYKWSGEKPEYFILPAVEVREKGSRKMKVLEERAIPFPEFLRFLGYYLGDGHVRKLPRHDIEFSQHIRNENTLMDICQGIGADVRKYQKGKDCSVYTYVIQDIQLAEYLRKLGYSADKYIPRKFMELDPDYLRILLEGYMAADSHKKDKGYILSSVSEMLMGDVQELILKAYGQMCTVRPVWKRYKDKPYKYYRLHFTPGTKKREYASYGEPEVIEYTGEIRKLKLAKNQYILVRYNGVIGVCSTE